MFKLKKSLELDEKGDVGLFVDLATFLVNICADELHSKFSYDMDGDEKWLELAKREREIRTKYMQLMVKKADDQKWCKSKHKLVEVMTLIEIGNRYYQDGLKEQAKECYKDSKEILEQIFEMNDIGGENVK